jgi:hypothetical protein
LTEKPLKRRWQRFNALAALLVLVTACASNARGQAVPYARTYPKTRAEVDQSLKDLGAYAGQKLPILDGFVATTPKPISHYERAFYQLAIELFPGTGTRGGTVVQVTAKITAWYADSDPSKSGYEVLASNGRLEFDLLDRLDEKLGTAAPGSAHSSATSGLNSRILAPKAKLDLSGVSGISQLPGNTGTATARSNDELQQLRAEREEQEKRMQELSGQLQTLEEIQKNQAHPVNLVAVKKSGTPVMAKPAEASRVLFLAAAGDEFEYLEANGAWLHVGISGVSRGYVKRSNVDLTDFIVSRLQAQEDAEGKSDLPFQIAREETNLFPGDWESLRGKKVKIYTVQPVSQVAAETDAKAKLAFAVSLFRKFSPEAGAPQVEGVVVIYDSADGGIIGATLASVEQMAEGTLSKENFWKQCYLDPPEAFQPTAKQ